MLKKVMSEPEFFVRENSRSKIRETLKSFSPGQSCGCFAVVQICVMEFKANYLASQMDFTMSQINCVNCMTLYAQDITVRQLHSTVTTKLSSASFLA